MRTSDDPFERERLIPFPGGDGVRRRRDMGQPHDAERSTRPRRARRRRGGTPWLQRNALSIAALSFLVALLGIGFGVVQLLTRPEPSPALLAVNPPEQATTLSVANVGTATSISVVAPLGTTSNPANRAIQASARAIEANYTVEAGDTLARIAARYNTTVERIQAFNANLTDPRTLRIGAKLVIPPPL
jgi:LysM domain